MKTVILSVAMMVAGFSFAKAQVVSNNYDTPVTQETTTEEENGKETFSYVGFGFESFDSYGGFENYGLAMHALTPNGFGMDFNLRASLEDHGNYNVDLGANYSFKLWGNDDSKLLATLALGPSFRLQDQFQGFDDQDKEKYKEKFFVDLYINPRVSFRYKRVVVSAGYFFWAAKFKFSKDYRANGFSATLGYCF